MDRLKKIWKPVEGFEGFYEVSNYGEIKSLTRTVPYTKYSPNGTKTIKERIIRPSITEDGYLKVQLFKNCKYKVRAVAHLVWDAFGNKLRDGHKLQVDHKDNNTENNNIDNLQLLTNRENTTKSLSKRNRELPVGVCYDKSRGKFLASIYINGHHKYLGRFDKPELASQAYQNKLKERDWL